MPTTSELLGVFLSDTFPSDRPFSTLPDTMTIPDRRTHDQLHGITLERMLNSLVDKYGWARMGERIPVRCFTSDPSVSSSLKFLRRTPWARAKVEALYLEMVNNSDG